MAICFNQLSVVATGCAVIVRNDRLDVRPSILIIVCKTVRARVSVVLVWPAIKFIKVRVQKGKEAINITSNKPLHYHSRSLHMQQLQHVWLCLLFNDRPKTLLHSLLCRMTFVVSNDSARQCWFTVTLCACISDIALCQRT